MGCAKTGSGKTAAFVLPVLQKLSEDPYGIFCLVLTPTRSVCSKIMHCRLCWVYYDYRSFSVLLNWLEILLIHCETWSLCSRLQALCSSMPGHWNPGCWEGQYLRPTQSDPASQEWLLNSKWWTLLWHHQGSWGSDTLKGDLLLCCASLKRSKSRL